MRVQINKNGIIDGLFYMYFKLCSIVSLTLSAHAPGGYIVILSVDLSTTDLSDRLVLNLE